MKQLVEISGVLTEKLTVAQQLQKFSNFYGSRRFSLLFTKNPATGPYPENIVGIKKT